MDRPWDWVIHCSKWTNRKGRLWESKEGDSSLGPIMSMFTDCKYIHFKTIPSPGCWDRSGQWGWLDTLIAVERSDMFARSRRFTGTLQFKRVALVRMRGFQMFVDQVIKLQTVMWRRVRMFEKNVTLKECMLRAQRWWPRPLARHIGVRLFRLSAFGWREAFYNIFWLTF